MKARRLFEIAIVVATVCAAAWLLAFFFGYVELGVEGEWTWDRQKIGAPIDVAIPIVIAIIAVGAYLIGVLFVSVRLGDEHPKATRLMVPVVALLGFFVLWALQSCAPSPHRQLKPNWVLYAWGVSGYFDEALEFDSVEQYLAGYEAEMAEGDVLHKGTHPPGLVIANILLQNACKPTTEQKTLYQREQSTLADIALATMPKSVRKEFRSYVPSFKVSERDFAALWLSVLVTQLLAALTVIPLYGLLRRTLSASLSLQLAALWPLVPGLTVFLPKSDVLYPVLGCTFLYFALAAWDKGSAWRGAVAGIVFWLGMMLSLAMLPFAVVAVLHCSLRWKGEQPTARAVGTSISGALAGFVAATGTFVAVTGVSLWRTWLLNYQNHSGFYEKFERTYSAWVVMNPLELVLTLGAPLAVVALFGLVAARKSLTDAATPLAVCVTWALLWLSGKNMGEAARLWILLTPLFIWAGGTAFIGPSDSGEHSNRWWTLALCQAVIAILTAAVVHGFPSHGFASPL